MSFFQTEQQKATFDKVKDILLKEYGEKYVGILKSPEGEEIGFGMYRGSTDIQVRVYPYKQTHSNVTISAVLTYQTQVNPNLFEWVARQNTQIMFGSLGFIEYKEKPGWGNVVFYYDLLGETLDPDELFNAFENAAFIADKWDDYIVENFGGETTQMSLDKQKKTKEQQGGEGKENWE